MGTTTTVQHTTIPAAPGWTQCTPIFNEDRSITDIYEAPVIAWVIQRRIEPKEGLGDLSLCWAQAVVVDDWNSQDLPQYLKRPDGLYVSQDFCSYKTREDLIEAMREDTRAAAARAAARAAELSRIP